jgi:hypothetical protein
MAHASQQSKLAEVRNVIGRAFIFAMVLLLGISERLQAQAIPRPGQAECPGDTVDRMGPEVAQEARDFLGKLRNAVERGDKKQVASMLRYPIRVHFPDKTVVMHNSEEFARNYGRIVNDSVKAKIIDETSSRCLFANSQGFMVGDGEVWFDEFSHGVLKIITFNVAGSSKGHASKP